MSTLEATEVDHYTPLARAVAAIDRDDYAGRFAVYDQAHKTLLRRLATTAPPPSGAELEREEQAFREAVRRVEFADELAHEEADSPALVPSREPHAEEPPAEEPLQELRRDAPWPEVRPRHDAPETADAHGLDFASQEFASQEVASHGFASHEPDIAVASLVPARASRAVMRRVGERMLLAILTLGLGGVWLYLADQRQPTSETAPAAVEPIEAAAPASPTTDAGPPGWLSSPELFYTAPSFGPATARAPRADAPPPARRP